MQNTSQSEFDAYSKSYRDAVNRSIAFSGLKVDFFTRIKVDYFLDLVEITRPGVAHTEVLDVGCGIGNSHPLLARRVAKITGVDVSETCLAEAAAQNPTNEYRSYDGQHLPFGDASFDAVSAVCVFHHVPVEKRTPLAKDIRRVLRKDGLFVIFEHNPLNPLTRRVVDRCEFDKDAILLRSSEAEYLLEQAGFHSITSRFILAVPAQGPILRGVDRLFARLPLGAQYFTMGQA